MAQSSPIAWDAAPRTREMVIKHPVDLEHLTRQTSGDPQVEREALQLFIVQSRLYLQRLRGAVGERAQQETAHSLKGSAAAIGAWGVAGLCEQLEQIVSTGNAHGYRNLLADLDTELCEVTTFVERRYTAH